MRKYKYSMTHDGPKTWHTCGPITKEHAKNQFKAFGVVYQCNGVWILDYKAISDERNSVSSVPKGDDKPSGNVGPSTESRQVEKGGISGSPIGAEQAARQSAKGEA